MTISKTTAVRVIRKVRAFRDADAQEHGPMPLHKAVSEGWTSESSGTVAVRVLIDSTGEEITYSPRSGKWVLACKPDYPERIGEVFPDSDRG